MPDSTLGFFVTVVIRFFFLLTPFFVLTMFLSLTRELEPAARRALAIRVIAAVVVTALILYFFGNAIFKVFGITLDSFRIGAGALLFLSAVQLVHDGDRTRQTGEDGDIAVVPLAIPITIGPATTGALLVMGAETHDPWLKVIGCLALLLAIACVGTLLLLAGGVERVVGRRGLRILSKITGLILAALAAEIIFTGVRNFLTTPMA